MSNVSDKAFTFKEGMNEHSEGTFECKDLEYRGCIYQHNGRCCYRVASIQSSVSRACYDDIMEG